MAGPAAWWMTGRSAHQAQQCTRSGSSCAGTCSARDDLIEVMQAACRPLPMAPQGAAEQGAACHTLQDKPLSGGKLGRECACTLQPAQPSSSGGKPGSASSSECLCPLQSYGRCHQHHLSAAGERPASAKATFMAGTRPQSKREARQQEAGKWRRRRAGTCHSTAAAAHVMFTCLLCPCSSCVLIHLPWTMCWGVRCRRH